MSSSRNYEVSVESYATRHYIKGFEKKYKSAWDITLRALKAEIAHIDTVTAETDRAEVIHTCESYKIVKLYFRVAGTNQSAKASGNRAIIYVDESAMACRLLLVYSKNDIAPPNETQKWENMVKAEFPDLWDLATKTANKN